MGTYRVVSLDDSLGDVGELNRVRSISIDRSISDKASMLESCSVTFDQPGDFRGGWHRIERIDGDRKALGVFRLERDSLSINRGVSTVTAVGYSVLKPADETILPPGSYAKAGEDGVALAVEMLSTCPGKTFSYGQVSLSSSIVFDDGASALDAAWNVLDAIGYRIRLDGNGDKHVEPLPESASLELNSDTFRSILPGVSVSRGEVKLVRTYDGSTRPGDLAVVDLPRYGADIVGRVKAQSLGIGPHLSLTETISEEVRGWKSS